MFDSLALEMEINHVGSNTPPQTITHYPTMDEQMWADIIGIIENDYPNEDMDDFTRNEDTPTTSQQRENDLLWSDLQDIITKDTTSTVERCAPTSTTYPRGCAPHHVSHDGEVHNIYH